MEQKIKQYILEIAKQTGVDVSEIHLNLDLKSDPAGYLNAWRYIQATPKNEARWIPLTTKKIKSWQY